MFFVFSCSSVLVRVEEIRVQSSLHRKPRLQPSCLRPGSVSHYPLSGSFITSHILRLSSFTEIHPTCVYMFIITDSEGVLSLDGSERTSWTNGIHWTPWTSGVWSLIGTFTCWCDSTFGNDGDLFVFQGNPGSSGLKGERGDPGPQVLMLSFSNVNSEFRVQEIGKGNQIIKILWCVINFSGHQGRPRFDGTSRQVRKKSE